MLLDGPSLLYRTLGSRAPDGLVGLASLVDRLVREEAPAGLAIALDAPGRLARQQLHPGYKAVRRPTPEGVRAGLRQLPELARAIGIPIHRAEGQEGDDVLASLAARIPGPVRLVTADRDLLQLIDPRISVRWIHQKSRTHRIMDRGAFLAEYGFPPEQLPTFRAMVGDPADRIPGIPGLGPPTARRLCKEHGDAAGILAALDSGRIRNPRVPPLLSAGRDELARWEALGRLERGLPLSEPLWAPVDRAGLAGWLSRPPEIGDPVSRLR